MADVSPDSAGRAGKLIDAGVRALRVVGIDLGWTGKGSFDYSTLDGTIAALRSLGGGLYCMLAVSVDPPAWWLEEHPEERAGFCLQGAPTCVSWASRRWKTEAGQALTRLVRHVSGAPAALQLVAGEAGAWRHPHAELLPDVGPRMTERFHTAAKQKYRHNEGLLRQAWDNPRATFASIRCPSAEERRRGDVGLLRDPRQSRFILDYYECLNTAQTEAALSFCAAARRAASDRLSIGLAWPLPGPLPEAGGCLQEPILDSDGVNFIVATGGSVAEGSCELRGRAVLHAAGGEPWREWALARASGASFALPPNAPIELAREAAAAERRIGAATAPKSTPQVALIVDPTSPIFLAGQSEQGRPVADALARTRATLALGTGASSAAYLISDLAGRSFPDAQLFLFPDSLCLSGAERRTVDALVKRSGRMAAWLWAPGVVGESGISAENGQRLCGQRLRLEPAATDLRGRIAESDDPLTWGLHSGATFGAPIPASPTITVPDRTSKRLGANSSNKTLFAALRRPEWTSVVYGAVSLSGPLPRNLAAAAGCHVYTQDAGCIVVAHGGLIALLADRAGAYRISLPGQHDVTDARTGRRVARGVAELEVSLAAGSATLLLLRKR
jgi:hypothetical protein